MTTANRENFPVYSNAIETALNKQLPSSDHGWNTIPRYITSISNNFSQKVNIDGTNDDDMMQSVD